MAASLAALALLASACSPDSMIESEPSVEPEHSPAATADSSPEQPDPIAIEGAAIVAQDAAPEELASDPLLQWRGFDPGVGEVSRLESVGDGRVLAYFWHLAERAISRIAVTSDGTTWTDLPMPEGIKPHAVDVSGGLWLMAGRDADISEFYPTTLERVFVSSDRGGTWTEVPIDSASPAPHLVHRYMGVTALVSGERIVLASEVSSYIEWEALLIDRGLVSQDHAASVLFAFPDELHVAVYKDPDEVRRVRAGSIGIDEPPPVWDEVVEFGYVELGLDEMGLTADQRSNPSWLHPQQIDNPRTWHVRVFSGDSAGLASTVEYRGYVVEGTSTAGGFVLHGARPEGRGEPSQQVLVTTANGGAWSEDLLDPDIEHLLADAAVGGCVTLWGMGREGGFSTIQDVCVGQAPKTVAVLPGVVLDPWRHGAVSTGPAGLVARAGPPPQGDTWIGWSADGTEWEWQDAAAVFGTSNVDLAVGSDFLLAYAQGSGWFIADVPGG
ncbi:MAG: hypothetical protein OXG40_08735 [Acidimicrobiaceae bacterium]|nr:hypothetical protein [Acidimicrobiaceae bacterium]